MGDNEPRDLGYMDRYTKIALLLPMLALVWSLSEMATSGQQWYPTKGGGKGKKVPKYKGKKNKAPKKKVSPQPSRPPVIRIDTRNLPASNGAIRFTLRSGRSGVRN